jgi:hypothetical protein
MSEPGYSCKTRRLKFEVTVVLSTVLVDFSRNEHCPNYLLFLFSYFTSLELSSRLVFDAAELDEDETAACVLLWTESSFVYPAGHLLTTLDQR